jgi:FMN phosphatase YigB (HAD superfamily)
MALRAIVFDLFDTLVDLHWERLPETPLGRGSTTRLHEVVSRHRSIDLESFVEELRESDRALFETTYKLGIELPALRRMEALVERLGLAEPELPHELCEVHMGLLRSVAVHQPHHREVLAALSAGLRIGVCSNFSHAETALQVLEEAGLRDSIHAVVISETNGYRKPRPEIFADVLERLDCDPAETLHVGDSLTADVAGAAGARINTAWLTRRIPDPDAALADYDGPEPEYVLADLAELVPLVSDRT